MRIDRLVLSAAALSCVHAPAVLAGDLKVVVTSKPIHALVAGVMGETGRPQLLVEGQASPHTFALKPSGAAAIQAADVFFRVSESIEPFTRKIVGTLAPTVSVVTLAETPGLLLLDLRRGATFEADGHAGGHGGGHDHGKAGGTSGGKDGGQTSAHHDDDDDDAGGKDGHVWLDPANAKLMVAHIADVLGRREQGNASVYAANAADLSRRIDATRDEIAAKLAPLAGRPFVVFHDATHYFERAFGLAAAGSITVSPDVLPSAKRLTAVRRRIATSGAVCVFGEPQASAKLMATVTEGTAARFGTLDPEGLLLPPGSELYFTLLTTLADSAARCLLPAT